MPTVLRAGPYRFFFYSGDRDEPPHVHVEHQDGGAKYWLDPVRLDRSGGFSGGDLRAVERIIEGHQPELLEAWHEFFQS